MRKGVRITLEPALEHAVISLARIESRSLANCCVALIKAGLEQRRAQQRERNAEQSPQ
jgi:hypothetical protein